MRSLCRGIRVLVSLTPLVVGFLRDRRRWSVVGGPARRSERHHRRRAEKLVARMAKLGPTFIKLGQLMSARADIFPEPYLTAIGTLQDQAPPDPTDKIIAVIERELGRPVDEAFDEFERKPVAAARARVSALRPSRQVMMSKPAALSARPKAVPISPGLSTAMVLIAIGPS